MEEEELKMEENQLKMEEEELKIFLNSLYEKNLNEIDLDNINISKNEKQLIFMVKYITILKDELLEKENEIKHLENFNEELGNYIDEIEEECELKDKSISDLIYYNVFLQNMCKSLFILHIIFILLLIFV